MKQPTTPSAGKAASVGPALSADAKAKITEWSQISEWLKKGKAREMELRKELVSLFVKKPVEGTNNVQGEGYAVKVSHKITRTLDEAALDAVMPQLPEDFRVIGNLISYKPSFSLDVYRAMSDENKKIFEQALTIKDGSPELEIIFREEAPAETAPSTGGVDFKKLAAKARKERAAKENKPAPAAKPAKSKKK